MMDADEIAAAVRAGDRLALARAITLVESTRPEDQDAARELLGLLGPGGSAQRIGISGPPGVGKSTFLDAFGGFLVARGRRPAVLTVDPSSSVSGGSILGDKARMQRLAQEPRAFVRPSPSGGAHGGVARRTREALLLCEAAGYDLLLVETVGVGQAETAVAEMVDEFLVLHQPGSGDELQGIKRGILELADVVAVNKADGAQASAARDAARDLSAALRLYGPREGGWTPRVCTISALEGSGFEELWGALAAHHAALAACGALERRRSAQRVRWMRALVEERVLAELDSRPGAAARRAALEARVAAGEMSPAAAAAEYWSFRPR